MKKLSASSSRRHLLKISQQAPTLQETSSEASLKIKEKHLRRLSTHRFEEAVCKVCNDLEICEES